MKHGQVRSWRRPLDSLLSTLIGEFRQTTLTYGAGYHVIYARAAGMTEAEIERIPSGPDAPEWAEEDRTLLRAADELHRAQTIDDATWSDLSRRWNRAQLVEIPFVVGNYTMLSMVANATGVPLEPELPPMPARN